MSAAASIYRKDNKVKVLFTVHVRKVQNLPNTCLGSNIFVEAKMGSSSSNVKVTKTLPATRDGKNFSRCSKDFSVLNFTGLRSNTVVMFDDKLTLTYTMYQDLVTDKMYSKKQLLLTVYEVRNKIKKQHLA